MFTNKREETNPKVSKKHKSKRPPNWTLQNHNIERRKKINPAKRTLVQPKTHAKEHPKRISIKKKSHESWTAGETNLTSWHATMTMPATWSTESLSQAEANSLVNSKSRSEELKKRWKNLLGIVDARKSKEWLSYDRIWAVDYFFCWKKKELIIHQNEKHGTWQGPKGRERETEVGSVTLVSGGLSPT